MSKRRLGTKRRSHITRNLVIAVILIAVTAIGVAATGALNGFLNPQPTSFPVIIHVYDTALLPGGPDTFNSPNQLVAYANVSMANATVLAGPPLNFVQPTPSGVLAPTTPLLDGTYHVGATAVNYAPAESLYVVGPNCDRKDSIGNCHIWIGLNKAS